MEYFTDTPLGKIFKRLVLIALIIALFLGFAAAVLAGIDKEQARQEEMFISHCKYYADSINETYGREVCPPTERG